MPVDDWGPKILTNCTAVLATAKSANVMKTTGKAYAYDKWPPALQPLPAIMIGTQGGSQDYGEGSPAVAIHNVRLMLYVSLGVSLAMAQQMAWPIVEIMRNQFAQDMTLDGTCKSFEPIPPPGLFYDGPGLLRYADKQFAGIIFNYRLKDVESGTFTVQR